MELATDLTPVDDAGKGMPSGGCTGGQVGSFSHEHERFISEVGGVNCTKSLPQHQDKSCQRNLRIGGHSNRYEVQNGMGRKIS